MDLLIPTIDTTTQPQPEQEQPTPQDLQQEQTQTQQPLQDFVINEKVITEAGNLLAKLREKLNTLLYLKTEADKLKIKEEEINKIYDIAVNELEALGAAIILLKDHYNTKKTNKIETIEIMLTDLVNTFFNDIHKFKLNDDVVRSKNTIELVSVDANGESLGNIQETITDSQQQMVGYAIQKTILNSLGSKFMILDEAFSSFGVKEVAKLPPLIRSIPDFQQIIVEHKQELLDELGDDIVKIELSQSNNILYHQQADKLKAINQWNNYFNQDVTNLINWFENKTPV